MLGEINVIRKLIAESGANVSRPKWVENPIPVASFRLTDDHLAILDQRDRTGEGRSAVLRRILDQVAASHVLQIGKGGMLVCRQQEEASGSPG